MKYLFIAATAFLLYCCKNTTRPQSHEKKQKEIETGALDTAGIYSVDEIGWTTRIPEGWDVLTREQTRKLAEGGKKTMEKSLDIEIDASGVRQLLNLRKDAYNSFHSSMEEFDEEGIGSNEERTAMMYDQLKETYKTNGIHATYKEDTSLIDGLTFSVLKVKLYSPDKEKVILNQVVYSRHINGHDVALVIHFNNEDDRKELEEMLFSSKFSKRD